ncbi:hypothetical protein F5Y15DRAFT_405752 [Xylariaceae sp. FL0016]|nr:hypothetical protein F5Y15DRAFT_405752 [Xylariaceae sp. FL0016]
MSAPEVDQASTGDQPAGLPDYMTDPNAVMKDTDAAWRYGQPPDYTKTRAVWAETKSRSHAPDSLPSLVENLVKNWEIEASFKTSLSDWRTVDHARYSFAVNGAAPSSAEHMLRVGTYNAILGAGPYYDPAHSDFAASHKTFKRMMPTFAWEVLEVYTEPPVVAFKWRHWGVMKNDYVGWNSEGEKVTVQAHGGPINIEGVTTAYLNDKMQVTRLKTWFDADEMFRQMDPEGKASVEAETTAQGGNGLTYSKESGPAAVNGNLVDLMRGCPVTGHQEAAGPITVIPEMNAE